MNPIKLIKAYLIASSLEKQALTEVKMENQTKPGWKTTAFWLTVLSQAPVIMGVFLGASNPWTIGVGAVTVVAYQLIRSWNKTSAAQVGLAALNAAAEAAAKLEPPKVEGPQPK